MRNNVISSKLIPFGELLTSTEYDDRYSENDLSDSVSLPIERCWLYRHLDCSVLNELRCQFTDFGLEDTKFFCTPNNKLYYGNLLITGDIMEDLFDSKVGLYILDVENNVIYSERI